MRLRSFKALTTLVYSLFFVIPAFAQTSEIRPPKKAIAVLYPTDGNTVTGTVVFEVVGNKVKVNADVKNLTPGAHGFHIHERGDCTGGDGRKAGGHFMLGESTHGAPTDNKRHVGDLGNLNAHENGTAQLVWEDPLISLSGPNSILGRAVIIHEDADDMKTQPTGGAGDRVACGVIGIADF